MPEELWPLKKCARCEWLFIMSAENATLCNECGDNQLHPPVCLESGTKTSRETLLKLVPYILSFVPGSADWTAKDVVKRDVENEIEKRAGVA